jgi:hypothetical protein
MQLMQLEDELIALCQLMMHRWQPRLGMRRPVLPFQVAGLGGLVTESHPPALNHRVVE